MTCQLRRPHPQWIPSVFRLEERVAPATTQWIGNNKGMPQVWSDDNNWTAGKPGPGDTAVFSAKVGMNPVFSQTSIVDMNVEIAGISSDMTFGGPLTLAATLTTTGTSNVTSNKAAGVVQIDTTGHWLNSGTLNFGDVNVSTMGKITNQGTLSQSSTLNIAAGTTSTYINESAATWIIPGSGFLDTGIGTNSTFTNDGLLRYSGMGTSPFEVYLNNEGGTIEVKSGTLDLVRGGHSKSGTFNVSPGAILEIGTFDVAIFEGVYTGGGGGEIRWNTPLSAGTGMTADFPTGMLKLLPGATLTSGQLTNLGHLTMGDSNTVGVLTVTGKGGLTNKCSIVQNENNLVLHAESQITNEMGATWEFIGNGDITSGSNPRPTMINRGLIRKSGGSATTLFGLEYSNEPTGMIDVLAGTLALDSTAKSTGGSFNVAGGTTLNISFLQSPTYEGAYTATGTGTILWARPINFGVGCTFNFPTNMLHMNAGAINSGKLTIANHLTIDNGSVNAGGTLVNQGTLVQNGSLAMQGGATITNEAAATWTMAGDVNINWLTLVPEPVVTNKGLIRKSAGTSTSFISGFRNDANGKLEVQTGTLDLRGSGTSLGGDFTVASGATLDIATSAVPILEGKYVGTGGGKVLWNGPIIAGTGCTFDFPAGMLQWSAGVLNNGTLTNLNHVTFTAGTMAAATAFINQGRVDHVGGFNLATQGGVVITNETTGIWDFQTDFGITAGGAPTLAFNNKGLVRRSAGSTSSAIGGVWSNFGTIEILTGTMNAAGSFVDQGGWIDLAINTTFNTPGNLELTSGTLRGSGKVTDPINNSGGAIRPGTSPGVLSIVGNYTQSGAGQLFMEISGTGSQFIDQLVVTGKVTLGGPLNVNVDFTPAVGQKFVIIDNDLNDAVVGNFDSLVEGATLMSNGVTLAVSYKGGTGNDVELTVTNVVANLPPRVANFAINDGAVQRSLVTSMRVDFDQIVNFTGSPAAAFDLKRQSDNMNVTLSALVDNSGPGSVVTLTFTGGPIDTPAGKMAPFSLSDGRYTLVIDANQISSPLGGLDGDGDGQAGGNFVIVGNPTTAPKLYRLFGDADANGTVNAFDFAAFRSVFGLSGPSMFDFNGDNQTNAADFAQFRARFGLTV